MINVESLFKNKKTPHYYSIFIKHDKKNKMGT